MSHYVVVAEFAVLPERVDDFVALMTRHAALSRAEPGCHIFEVNQDCADRCKFLLFERYQDEQAYLAHRATAHYNYFGDWAPGLVVPKNGELFQRRSVFCSTS
jgi:(4S)-4-hydroxy-5-phosphonooxypentane-2,3-dione isomerase